MLTLRCKEKSAPERRRQTERERERERERETPSPLAPLFYMFFPLSGPALCKLG